jgi:nickel-dependent lactate racemase
MDGMEVEVPDENVVAVLRMNELTGLPDPKAAVEESLRSPIHSAPLAEIARGRADACIVISDTTRPVPNALILEPVIRTLEGAGIPQNKITILIGTGIHRPNLGEELERLVGKEIASRYRVINHYSKKTDDMADCGKTVAGIPLFINRHYVEADLKILTGLIEPHLWAGYSGGRKAILPGISSLETMKYMHGYKMIADPGTRYGNLINNPFHEAGLEVVERVGVDFNVNVTISEERRVTGVFAGDCRESHLEGCRFLEEFVVAEVSEPVDVAITSGGGAPLDATLYQTVKGMSGAAPIVKEGGTIIVVSSCNEGAGSPEFTELLRNVGNIEDFFAKLQSPGFFVTDQWIAQEMYGILQNKRIMLRTHGIEEQEVRRYLLEPVTSVESAVARCLNDYGPNAKIAVIPEGPYVITRVASVGE